MRKSKYSISSLKQVKISRENAQKITVDMCVYFDIDIDSYDDRDSASKIETLLDAVTDFISRGFLEFKEGKITQHLQGSEHVEIKEITYKAPNARDKLALDGKGDDARHAQIYSLLGTCSGLGEQAIYKLKGIDLKVAEAVSSFFL